MQRRDDEVPIGDRLISAAPYLLPIADGIGCVFGRKGIGLLLALVDSCS